MAGQRAVSESLTVSFIDHTHDSRRFAYAQWPDLCDQPIIVTRNEIARGFFSIFRPDDETTPCFDAPSQHFCGCELPVGGSFADAH